MKLFRAAELYIPLSQEVESLRAQCEHQQIKLAESNRLAATQAVG
jgi:hypothetical protein